MRSSESAGVFCMLCVLSSPMASESVWFICAVRCTVRVREAFVRSRDVLPDCRSMSSVPFSYWVLSRFICSIETPFCWSTFTACSIESP